MEILASRPIRQAYQDALEVQEALRPVGDHLVAKETQAAPYLVA